MLKRFIGLYGTFSCLSAIGLARINKSGIQKEDSDLPSIAVIVAARNEENNLPELIASLSSQNYPEEKVSFWIIDDESEDNTFKIIDKAQERDSRFHALKTDLTSDISAPKKRALDTGIRSCDAEWIVTTDADCMPGQGWLRALATYMLDDIGVVLGYSPLVGAKDLVQRFAEGESWSSAAICAAAVGLGYPFNAFGRNFSFRRKIYLDLEGYGPDKSVASGDDDLFLQRVVSKTDWRVAFASDNRSFVPSKVMPAERFFRAKARHMSVGPRYAPGWVLFGAIGSILFMGLGLATVAAWLGLASKARVWKAWRWKWFFDIVMISSASRILGEPKRGLGALSVLTLAPFVFWGIWPKALFGNVDWKGRSFGQRSGCCSKNSEC
jgi:glycosyltransferase involved in cell wall biosynthesis